MKDGMKRAFFFLIALISSSFSLFSDMRTEPIDVFILTDVSISMESKIKAVAEYLDSTLIETVLIPGDSITIITFYGSARIAFETQIISSADVKKAADFLRNLTAEGKFTDIGNALDLLQAVLEKREVSNRIKFIQLYSDFIQEAPKGSKYQDLTSVLKHPLLSASKTVVHGEWRETTIGLDTGNRARLASETLFPSIASNKDRAAGLKNAVTEAESTLSETSGGENANSDLASDLSPTDAGRNPFPYWLVAVAGAAFAICLTILVLRRKKK
jgi:hypothetical protein